jgi:tetratricopeptide (TPR) repeat protein
MLSKNEEALILNELATTYSELGEKVKAIGLHHQAALIFKQLYDKRAEASAINSMASILSTIGYIYCFNFFHNFDSKQDKAIEMYQRAIALIDDPNLSARGIFLHNIAVTYR